MNTVPSNSNPDSAAAFARDENAVNSDVERDSDMPEAPAPSTAAMASEDDRRLHDVGLAAMAAVSQYPHAITEENNSLLVSEVVRAVTGNTFHSPYSNSPAFETDVESFSHGAGPLHSAESDIDSMPSGSEALSSGTQTTDNGVDMESIVRNLIERTATWQHMATVANDGDNGNLHKEMVMDYDSSFEEEYTSPSSGPDDDLEDLLRFYPGEEEYYHQRNAPHSPDTAMDDINLDEFYQNINYETVNVNLSQPPEPPVPPEGPLGADTELPGPSVLHTTSTVCLILFT